MIKEGCGIRIDIFAAVPRGPDQEDASIPCRVDPALQGLTVIRYHEAYMAERNVYPLLPFGQKKVYSRKHEVQGTLPIRFMADLDGHQFHLPVHPRNPKSVVP